MTLKFVSLFPEHLDLNGDQANLRVLIKRLAWQGVSAEIISVNKGQSIPSDAALIFLGHGSIAAWADIESELMQLVPEIKKLISNGVAFMAVATGHERAIDLGIFVGKVTKRNRVSKFEVAEIDGVEVLGYLNSATDAPVIQKQNLVLGTQLHGPFFAKNPEFADAYLGQIAGSQGLTLAGPESNTNASLVAGIVKQVWELERELASE
jgi:CobQ-like glutamine amidotransferase family enzyme